ncbi:MAG: ribbon-helix-helix protein, CopG family [Planctomycetota bacterium]
MASSRNDGATAEREARRRKEHAQPQDPQLPDKTPVRLSVNMNQETAAALKEIADHHGVSVTEAVRRAVAIASFIEDELAKGKSVQVLDEQTGRVREVVLM